MREVEINGEPGCVFEDGDGRAIAVVALPTTWSRRSGR
jgi:hypothetical protein